MNTNTAYKISDMVPAKASCAGEKLGPGELVVNVGSTSAIVASAVNVASAAVTPSTRNSTTRCRTPPTRISNPAPTSRPHTPASTSAATGGTTTAHHRPMLTMASG